MVNRGKVPIKMCPQTQPIHTHKTERVPDGKTPHSKRWQLRQPHYSSRATRCQRRIATVTTVEDIRVAQSQHRSQTRG
ncbi:unnamed protein product, partial [Iphiclides podalirius]